MKKAPPQVTLGGKIGAEVWRRYVLPLLKDKALSGAEVARRLGVSRMTVSRWRKYL